MKQSNITIFRLIVLFVVAIPFATARADNDMRINLAIKTDKIDCRLKTDRVALSAIKTETKPAATLTRVEARRSQIEAAKVSPASDATRIQKTRRVAGQ